MDDIKIITAYCIIDEAMHSLGHKSHKLAQVTDAEVLTVAMVAAMYYQNHHERALFVMTGMRYLSKPLSTSRFNRRLHSLAAQGWLEHIMELVGHLFSQQEVVYIIDSIPVPVCNPVRAHRCRKGLVRGRLAAPRHYFGKCKAKRWSFYGWRLHLICTQEGVPVAFQMLPAVWHDLTPIYEMTYDLPSGARVYADKGYVSALVKRTLRPTLRREGVHLIAKAKKSMKRDNTFEEWCGLRNFRQRIESANSQLKSMGIQDLHARTDAGLSIKVLASLLALACINMF
jgi:DDE family transposase